jgi:hypothetical protein
VSTSEGRLGSYNVKRTLRIRSKAGAVLAMVTMLATTAGVAFTGVAPAAAATSTTIVGNGDVAPGGPGPWALANNTGTYSFVNGPATPPGGVGSLAMSIAEGNHEALYNYSYGSCAVSGGSCNDPLSSWTPLADIDALSFSAYRASGTTYPSLNVEADLPGLGSGYTSLVFVPDAGSISASPAWQTWDGLNPSDGTWYSTTTQATPPFNCAFQAAGCNASWSEIQTAYPSARVRYGLGPNVGSGGAFDGNIDDFTVGVSGTSTVFDFEPDCTTVCYVDAGAGNDFNTGLLGDPLQTIQAGVNRVTAGGTVNVAAGTYDASTTISKAVTLNGANAGIAGTGTRGAESLVERIASESGPVFNITTANQVTIDGFNAQFNGTDAVGGLLNSLTSANKLTFKNNLVDNSSYVNVLINATSSATLTFTKNKFTNIAQTSAPGTGVIAAWGVSPSGAQAAVTVTGNSFTALTDNDGVPAINFNTVSGTVSGNTFQNIHQYGILLAGKLGSLTIGSNLFDNIHNDNAAENDNRGSGIRTFGQPSFVAPVLVIANTFSNSWHGVRIANDSPAANVSNGNFKVTRNNIALNNLDTGISVAGGTVGVLDATCNWWGSQSGPGGGSTEGDMTLEPFLKTSNLLGPCPADVPGKPTSLSALPFNDHGAKLHWVAPASNGFPITGYRVIPYAAGVAQPAIIFNSTATTQVIGGLTDGTSYRFTVAARNQLGYGVPSALSAAMIAGAPGQPGTPTVTRPAAGQLKVTFAAPMNNGAPITSYLVSCASSNGGVTNNKTGTASPITVTGLTAGKSYQCRVNATNSRGAGPFSNPSAPINA